MTNLQQLTTIEDLTNIDQLINEYCANITKCDLTPSSWGYNANVSDEDIKAWAQLLFNKLIESKPSVKVYDKKRVPNYYNNGYHYEQIHKSNMIKIDF